MMSLLHLAAMSVPTEIVILVLGTIISVQTAVAGWVLVNLIQLRGRMHHLEAREAFVSEGLSRLCNRMDQLYDDLLPHKKK